MSVFVSNRFVKVGVVANANTVTKPVVSITSAELAVSEKAATRETASPGTVAASSLL